MSFRYKSALLSLTSFAIVYGWYFATLLISHGRSGHFEEVGRLLATIVLITIIQVIGGIALALTSPDSRVPMDERESDFDRRSTHIGYYLLLVGAMITAALLQFGARSIDLGNALLLAIVIAESVRQTTFLVLHHRTI